MLLPLHQLHFLPSDKAIFTRRVSAEHITVSTAVSVMLGTWAAVYGNVLGDRSGTGGWWWSLVVALWGFKPRPTALGPASEVR